MSRYNITVLIKEPNGDGEIRTHDPLLARQVLSQLSYTPTSQWTALLPDPCRHESRYAPSLLLFPTKLCFAGPPALSTFSIKPWFLFPMISSTTEQHCSFYFFFRKEVIQPHLPIRLPCYDFTPVIGPAFGSSLQIGWVTDFGRYRLPWCDGRCVQDPGTYSPRHSDSRLLAIPASCSRVADYNPN